MTLAGFARRGRVNVYTGAERVISPRRSARAAPRGRAGSKLRKRLKCSCSGPWKSADPVESSPRPRTCRAAAAPARARARRRSTRRRRAPGGEVPHRAQHLVGIGDVQNGCAHTATPPAAWIDLDRLLHRRSRARDVGDRARHEVGREQLLLARDALARQPFGVVRVREHGVGEMRAAEALAGSEGGVVEREAELAQAIGHRVDAAHPVGAEVLERRLQPGVARVELVAEDVQVLVLSVDARELGGGRQADAVLARGGERLGHAGDGVVVGQREQLDARGRRLRDHLRRRQRTVGLRRMGLEIEGGNVGAHTRPVVCRARGMGRLLPYSPRGNGVQSCPQV